MSFKNESYIININILDNELIYNPILLKKKFNIQKIN